MFFLERQFSQVRVIMFTSQYLYTFEFKLVKATMKYIFCNHCLEYIFTYSIVNVNVFEVKITLTILVKKFLTPSDNLREFWKYETEYIKQTTAVERLYEMNAIRYFKRF